MCSTNENHQIKLVVFICIFLLRGPESNRQSSGYEPDELPLLYPAISGYCATDNEVMQICHCITAFFGLLSKDCRGYMSA